MSDAVCKPAVLFALCRTTRRVTQMSSSQIRETEVINARHLGSSNSQHVLQQRSPVGYGMWGVCVCVREREREQERARAREGERGYVCERERETERGMGCGGCLHNRRVVPVGRRDGRRPLARALRIWGSAFSIWHLASPPRPPRL